MQSSQKYIEKKLPYRSVFLSDLNYVIRGSSVFHVYVGFIIQCLVIFMDSNLQLPTSSIKKGKDVISVPLTSVNTEILWGMHKPSSCRCLSKQNMF